MPKSQFLMAKFPFIDSIPIYCLWTPHVLTKIHGFPCSPFRVQNSLFTLKSLAIVYIHIQFLMAESPTVPHQYPQWIQIFVGASRPAMLQIPHMYLLLSEIQILTVKPCLTPTKIPKIPWFFGVSYWFSTIFSPQKMAGPRWSSRSSTRRLLWVEHLKYKFIFQKCAYNK